MFDNNHESVVFGQSDSNYATWNETRRIITGLIVRLENKIVEVKIGMQKIVALSTTESEIIEVVQCVQDMLYIMNLLESMELKVKKSMVVYSDNRGAVDFINGTCILAIL